MTTLRNLGVWMKRHFDFALILAALVEIPRWTVTFLAIHEPLWVGIPLGALLAYATSEGWRAYFANPTRVKLLCFNIASLAAATFVITPVLFSMASAPIDEIDLSALLPQWWLLAWSSVLAVTTFAPLIQLAAVKSTPTAKSQETAQDAHQKAATLTKSDNQSKDITASEMKPRSVTPEVTTKALEVEVAEAKEATPTVMQPAKQPQPTPLAPTPALRKVSNVTVNATDTELAAQLGVTRQAVAGMRRRGTLAARVARDLPDLAPVHVNGNGYHA